MTDEYDACSDNEILHLFQHVAMSNKFCYSNLILVTSGEVFFNSFMFTKNQQFGIIYGAVNLTGRKKKN